MFLNGIDIGSLRGDLVDRIAFFELSPIHSWERVAEQKLHAEFEVARPSIVGGLLTLVAAAERLSSTVHLDSPPRMVDHARVLAALDEHTGWRSSHHFTSAMNAAQIDVIDADPVARTVRAFMDGRRVWESSPTELYEALEPPTDRSWPRSPQALTGRLKRTAPSLELVGIHIETGLRDSFGNRLVRIQRFKQRSTSPIAPTMAEVDAIGGSAGITNERGSNRVLTAGEGSSHF